MRESGLVCPYLYWGKVYAQSIHLGHGGREYVTQFHLESLVSTSTEDYPQPNFIFQLYTVWFSLQNEFSVSVPQMHFHIILILFFIYVFLWNIQSNTYPSQRRVSHYCLFSMDWEESISSLPQTSIIFLLNSIHFTYYIVLWRSSSLHFCVPAGEKSHYKEPCLS